MKTSLIGSLLLLFSSLPIWADTKPRADILIADFEGDDYGNWKTTGTAFGKGPARGTLPNQMSVTGFQGKGLVNSFHGGDDATGTLTSPVFRIERHYLNFLIGGGKHPGKTCMNLIVEGKVVRSATGPNDRPGGSEHLAWQSWDVEAFAGKEAILRIVDEQTGGWGHVIVDHVIQSDSERSDKPAQRVLTITNRYLHLPVKNGASKRHVRFLVEGQTVREFEIELADDRSDFHVFSDVRPFQGKRLTVAVDSLPSDSKGLSSIQQADTIPSPDETYHELHRPQFHFSSRRGWLNDPNGMVWHEGEYHLYYQHNPYGWDWGNMHWGHAVSKDMIHWRELPIALYPRRFGDWAFSGSAVVDTNNTSGWGKSDAPPLVAAFTSTGRGECIVYSNDRGRSWTEYEGNPVVKHEGRDPRLLWHTGRKCWIIAVYDEHAGKRWIAFYSSADLKKWTFESRIDDFFECPDLFELTIEGEKDAAKWVLHAADGKYVLGDFDGHVFHKESGKQQLWYGNFYAAQSFSNSPEGRRIQIGWGQGIAFPKMPFNQQMTVPCRLTLRKTPEGIRMFAEPVHELEQLRGRRSSWTDRILKPGENPLADIQGDFFDVTMDLELKDAASVEFRIRGVPVVYDVKKQTITCKRVTAPLSSREGRIRLRLLVDRGSIELFGNDGRVALSVGIAPADTERSLALSAHGGSVHLRSLEAFELKSAWAK